MSRPSIAYESRRPAERTLYQIVHDHFETFRVRAASLRDGEGLPRFVEEEFRAFLRCGWLAGGFARFRCESCGLDRLVAFSCKGRGFCPSCGGRRMNERAAHLVDAVFPDVPVRQWVLSLPPRIRYQLAWNHDPCRAVVAVYLRSVLGSLRARARLEGVADGRGGAVAVVQRFGGALNLNMHVHALVLDGVFAKDRAGVIGFHPLAHLTDLDVAEVLATVEPRIRRLLARRGLGHITPEAQDGGPIALIRSGERITIDAEQHVIEVDVSADEMTRRRQLWRMPPFKAERGTLAKYIRLVRSASEGCVTDE